MGYAQRGSAVRGTKKCPACNGNVTTATHQTREMPEESARIVSAQVETEFRAAYNRVLGVNPNATHDISSCELKIVITEEGAGLATMLIEVNVHDVIEMFCFQNSITTLMLNEAARLKGKGQRA